MRIVLYFLIKVIFIIVIGGSLSAANSHARDTERLPSDRLSHVNVKTEEEKSEESGCRFLKELYFHSMIGYRFSTWKPIDRSDDEVELFSFEPERLHQINVNFILGLGNIDFLEYNYEGPFKRPVWRGELLDTSGAYKPGIETYSVGVNLFSITNYLIPENNSPLKYILRSIFSIRYRYTKESVFGVAKIKRSFRYIPRESYFSHRYTYIPFNPFVDGRWISGRNNYENHEISMAVYTYNKFEFRIGVSRSTWQRPSEHIRHIAYDYSYSIFETSYDVKNLLFGVQSNQRCSPGFNIDAIYKAGNFDRQINNASGDAYLYIDSANGRPNYTGFYLDVWYNFNSKSNVLSMTIGGLFDSRAWSRKYNESSNHYYLRTSSNGRVENDNFIKAYIGLVIKI